jgi:hypothetical protein
VFEFGQIIGPPLFKIALIQAGDANPEKLPDRRRDAAPPRMRKRDYLRAVFIPRGLTSVELSQLS